MATYSIGQLDIMIISLSVNVCVICSLLLTQIVQRVMQVLESKMAVASCLAELHRRGPHHLARVLSEVNFPRLSEVNFPRLSEVHFPRLSEVHFPRLSEVHFPKLSEVHFPRLSEVHFSRLSEVHFPKAHKRLTEQLTLWILVVLIFTALTYTTVSSLPFSHQPSPYPSFLINFILCASAARFMVAAARIALVTDSVSCPTYTRPAKTTGQSGHRRLDIAYNILSSVSSIVYLGYKQNLLFGVTASLMEISSTPLECCRLLKLTRRDSESYRKTALVSCIICFACRALLPSVLLLLALRQESPLVMDNVPMIAGVTLGSYFAFYHCLLLYQSVRRVLAPSAQYDTPYSCDSFIPFSIHDYPEVLRNDFRSETPPALSEDIEKNREAGMKDFSHRLMRSYDSSDVSSGELPGNDKFNVQKRKENSKYILLHKAPKEMYQDPLLVSLDHVSPDKHSSRAALLDSMVESGVDESVRL